MKEIDNRQLNGECNPLDEAINICSDGLIYPCTYSVGMEDFVIGSVFEGLYIKKIDKILAHNKEKIVYVVVVITTNFVRELVAKS